MHFRAAGKDSRGGATVAILTNDAEKTATISIARCNPTDVFCKKTGREIAAGRIRAALSGRSTTIGKVQTISIADPAHVKSSVAAVLAEEMASHNLY